MFSIFEGIVNSGLFYFSCALSLSIGSFINVVIYRLPIMLNSDGGNGENESEASERFNLFLPRSSCPHCGEKIKSYDNIPLLSWIILRGRCRYCKVNITARYLLVELFTLLTGMVMFYLVGIGIDWFFMVILFSLLLALAVIDFEKQLLPDCLTLSLLWCGLLWHSIMHPTFLSEAIIGVISGYIFLWLIYWTFKILTGREGLGYGDFKLLSGLGAWVGYDALPSILLIGSASSLLGLLAICVLRNRSWSQALPFGPGLTIAGGTIVSYRWFYLPSFG